MVFTGSFWVANSMKAISMIQGPVRGAHNTQFSDLLLEDQTGPMVLDRLLLGEGVSITAPLVAPFGAAFRSFIAAISPTGKRVLGSSNPFKPPDTGVAVIPTTQVGGGLKFADGAWDKLAGQGVLAATPSTAVVSAAGAAANATSIPVAALTKAIPSGARLTFLPGTLKTARLTAAAAIGATALIVSPIPTALVSADTAKVSDPEAIPTNGLFIFRASPDYDELNYTVDAGGRQVPNVTFTGMYSFQAGLPDDMHLGTIGDPMGEDLATVPSTFFFSDPTV